MTIDQHGQETPRNQNGELEAQAQEEQEENAVDVFAEITAIDSHDSADSDEDQTLDGEHDDELSDDTDASGNGDGDDNGEPDQQTGDGKAHSQETDGATQGETDVDLKSRNAKLQQDLRANSLRVSALNKHLAEARQTIKRLKEQEMQQSSITDDQLAELESDFPEAAQLAKAYAERLVNSLRSDLAPVHNAIDSNLESQQSDIERQETDRLLAIHPDVADILHGNQKAQFNQWLETQSNGVRQLYASPSADDAIALLNLYKRNTPTPAPQRPANSTSSSGTPAPKPNPKRDLASHAELPRRGPSRIGTEPDDPVAIFNAIAD